MKAIIVREFGGPEVLRLEDVPDPHPAAGQVLISVRAAGINPVETYVRSGSYPRLPQLPYTPGTDGAGRVEAVGLDVSQWRPGDRVYAYGSVTGTYADMAICDQSQLYPLPDTITFEQGAAIGIPYGTAHRALFHRGQAKAGETVVIHGASGGVGIAAIQLAVAAGLNVIATAGTDHGRQLALALGAHFVLNHEEANDPERINFVTCGRGTDLTIEMLANVNLGNDLRVMAKNGRVVVVGSRGTVAIDPRITMSNELDIRGMTLSAATPAELSAMHSALGESLSAGRLQPIVGLEVPLAEAPRGHQTLMEGDIDGKIVLIP